jgi:hypothetical protein
MRRDQILAAVSAAQLVTGAAGLAMALRRGHAYHFLFLRGRPERVAREAVTMGTAFSAPAPMLVAQAAAVVGLRQGGPGWPATVLAGLGAAMVPGYLGEELVRRRLRPSGYDRIETPLVASALTLSAAMAVAGWPYVRPPGRSLGDASQHG